MTKVSLCSFLRIGCGLHPKRNLWRGPAVGLGWAQARSTPSRIGIKPWMLSSNFLGLIPPWTVWLGSHQRVASIFTIHFPLCLNYLKLVLCQHQIELNSQCKICHRTEYHCPTKSQVPCIIFSSLKKKVNAGFEAEVKCHFLQEALHQQITSPLI